MILHKLPTAMELKFLRSGLLNIGLSTVNENDSKYKPSNKCLFLDRDGVILQECNYLDDPKQVRLEHGIREVIRLAKDNEYLVFVVTNQSGIERGYFG